MPDLTSAIPIGLAESAGETASGPEDQAQLRMQGLDDASLVSFVTSQKKRLRTDRVGKKAIWDECWMLYRGKEDFKDKEEWQSQIALPKSWNSVKQATNAVMRLLETAEMPWSIDPHNPDDMITALRAGQVSDLVDLFLHNSDFLTAFAEGLESGFITGMGVWKVWWGLEPRLRVQVDPQTRQILQQETMEGKLFVKAVDPYNFFWLRGSKFNDWRGTIEEITVSRWELLELASKGIFDEETVKKVMGGTSKNDNQAREQLRFDELPRGGRGQDQKGLEDIILSEYNGPILDKEGRVVEKAGYLLIANDDILLRRSRNGSWRRKPPYIAFSPLLLPFRSEGVGLIEMTRNVDHALNKLTNLSVDTLVFRHLPTFEAHEDVYENPEDLDTGLVPGKILRKNAAGIGMEGIKPVEMQDISNGMPLIYGLLDRSHQEGSLISEIQQSLPRVRGAQTLGEVELKDINQNNFLASMAKDIDNFALKPLVEIAMDTIMQNLDTTNDPRVGSVLGIGAEYLKGYSQADMYELVQGDYIVKVSGISDQIKKAEDLQNLIQFMNILGQNEAWLPYLRQDQFLMRVLDSFRPSLRDIENLVNDPATVEAQRAALAESQLTPEILKIMPQVIQIAAQLQRDQQMAATATKLQPQAEAAIAAEQQAQQAAADRQQQLAEAEFKAILARLKRIEAGEEELIHAENVRR